MGDPMTDGWPVCFVKALVSKECTPGLLHYWEVADWLEGAPLEDKSHASMWSPGKRLGSPDGTFSKSGDDVESVSMFVVDSDGGATLEQLEALGERDGYSLMRWGHTSYSHSSEETKGRVVFPLLEPVPVRRWGLFWSSATQWVESFGIKNDPATKDIGRFWFDPSFPPSRSQEFYSWINRGKATPPGARASPELGAPLLDPAWLLRTFTPKLAPTSRPRGFLTRPMGSKSNGLALARSWVATRHERMGTRAQGERNNYMYSCGILVGNIVHMGLFSEQDALTWRKKFISQAVVVGLTEDRAAYQWGRGYTEGLTSACEGLLHEIQRK